MRELVVLSGKGGTGKTTVAASLAKLLAPTVIVDADVDAADMHIMLDPKIEIRERFSGLGVARIDSQRCTSCGLCAKLCRFGAIASPEGTHGGGHGPKAGGSDGATAGFYSVSERRCEGCTLCAIACPAGAIEMRPVDVGEWYRSATAFGPMVHARLFPGAENSGKLVTMVRRQARELAGEIARAGSQAVTDDGRAGRIESGEVGAPRTGGFILVDGPPGIGCPVTASLTGASFALLVTEPTPSGVHDLERIADLAAHFRVPAAIVINKADLNERHADIIGALAVERGTPILGTIPFDREVMEAQIQKQTPLEMPAGHAANLSMRAIGARVARLLAAEDLDGTTVQTT